EQEDRILIHSPERVEGVVVEHDARPGEEVEASSVMLPCRGGDLYYFGIHHRLPELLVSIAGDLHHAVEIAAASGSHAAFPERTIAAVALSHTGPLGRQR